MEPSNIKSLIANKYCKNVDTIKLINQTLKMRSIANKLKDQDMKMQKCNMIKLQMINPTLL